MYLYNRYEILREKLLVELIKNDVGEGMWLALSESEQESRLVHTKLKERRLSANDGLTSHAHTNPSSLEYERNLFSLLGHGRLKAELVLNEENKKRSKLKDEGKCCLRSVFCLVNQLAFTLFSSLRLSFEDYVTFSATCTTVLY